MDGYGGRGHHDPLKWFIRFHGLNNKDAMPPHLEAGYQVAVKKHIEMRVQMRAQRQKREEHLGKQVPPPGHGAPP
jgi:hypothetical protein